MLRKPFHGRRIKQEIQKSIPIRTPSPNLNPVLESPGSPTRPTPLTALSPLPPLFFYGQNLPPTSYFRLTHQVTKFPLSTGFLTTGRSSAAYCSRAREPDPNTYLEHPNRNVESLPDERVLVFTGPSEDGTSCMYMVLAKHLSQELCREGERAELCREGERAVCIKPISPNGMEWRDCPLSTALELLKRNMKAVSGLELCPGDMYHIAMEAIRKHGRMVFPHPEQGSPEQVAYKPKIHLGCGIRVAYEEAMQYAVEFMGRHFPLQVAICEKSSLQTKIALIESSVFFEQTDAVIGPWKRRANPSTFSRLWRLGLAQLLRWIQYGIDFGRKK